MLCVYPAQEVVAIEQDRWIVRKGDDHPAGSGRQAPFLPWLCYFAQPARVASSPGRQLEAYPVGRSLPLRAAVEKEVFAVGRNGAANRVQGVRGSGSQHASVGASRVLARQRYDFTDPARYTQRRQGERGQQRHREQRERHGAEDGTGEGEHGGIVYQKGKKRAGGNTGAPGSTMPVASYAL